jgi:SAM-dependent methyltransferase
MYDNAFYDRQVPGSVASARVILPLVLERYGRPASVVDVGCGVGSWLSVAAELGVGDLLGVDNHDASPERMLIDAALFTRRNLEDPLSIGRRFDLAISVEVAEHLSAERSESFVSDLCGLADRVLFSAAIPGQGGDNHVNERWQSYWAGLFAGHDYGVDDCIRPRVWTSKTVDWWYAQNVLVFRRGQSSTTEMLDLAHPKCYERHRATVAKFQQSTRQLVGDIIGSLQRSNFIALK